MIKRTSAFVFILLANIVLMAHAVIPHHYHKEQVCVENTHCADDGVAHEHAAAEQEHEHDGDGSSSSCVLKQTVVLLSYQSKKDCNCNLISNSHNHSITNLYKLHEITPPLLGCISTPLASLSYHSYINASLGLRAPPVC